MILYDADITRLKKMETFILLHLDEDLGIKYLCTVFAISKAQLQRHFNCYFNMPVHHFVFAERMKRARELLTSKTNTVTDVALAVGYKDRTSFARAYKRYFKKPPVAQLKAPVPKSSCIPNSRL